MPVNAIDAIVRGAGHKEPVLVALNRMLDSVTAKAASSTDADKDWNKEFCTFCESAIAALPDIERLVEKYFADVAEGDRVASHRSTSGASTLSGGRQSITRASMMHDIACHVASRSSKKVVFLEQLTKAAMVANVKRTESTEATGAGRTLQSTPARRTGASGTMSEASVRLSAIFSGMKRGRESGLNDAEGPPRPTTNTVPALPAGASPKPLLSAPPVAQSPRPQGAPTLGIGKGSPTLQPLPPNASATSAPPLPLAQGRASGLPSMTPIRRPEAEGRTHTGQRGDATNSRNPPMSEQLRLMMNPWNIPQPYTHGVTMERTAVPKQPQYPSKSHALLDMCSATAESEQVLKMWCERNGGALVERQQQDASAISRTDSSKPALLREETDESVVPAPNSPLVEPVAFGSELFLHRADFGGEKSVDGKLLSGIVHNGVYWFEQPKLDKGGAGAAGGTPGAPKAAAPQATPAVDRKA